MFDHLALGRPNKVIAAELGIGPRTVEVHRARVMEKLEARSLADIVRLALAAAGGRRPQRPWVDEVAHDPSHGAVPLAGSG